MAGMAKRMSHRQPSGMAFDKSQRYCIEWHMLKVVTLIMASEPSLIHALSVGLIIYASFNACF